MDRTNRSWKYPWTESNRFYRFDSTRSKIGRSRSVSVRSRPRLSIPAMQTIAILQNNLNKSQHNTHSILNDPTSRQYAILMVQEQYFSTYTNSSLTHHSWTLIKSKGMENNPPRAAIYLNKTILPAHSYEPIPWEVPDTVALAIRLDEEQHPTLIINIYNTKNTIQ